MVMTTTMMIKMIHPSPVPLLCCYGDGVGEDGGGSDDNMVT